MQALSKEVETESCYKYVIVFYCHVIVQKSYYHFQHYACNSVHSGKMKLSWDLIMEILNSCLYFVYH